MGIDAARLFSPQMHVSDTSDWKRPFETIVRDVGYADSKCRVE